MKVGPRLRDIAFSLAVVAGVAAPGATEVSDQEPAAPAVAISAISASEGIEAIEAIAYPEGYREWVHVKSALLSPAHANFGSGGGFHHIYANPQALRGYRERHFPEGSIIVFDWLEMRDESGRFVEGPRRRLDVMVKDATRFATTGGWGFQRFAGDSHTERAATPAPQQCFACHERLQKDGLILSRYRP